MFQMLIYVFNICPILIYLFNIFQIVTNLFIHFSDFDLFLFTCVPHVFHIVFHLFLIVYMFFAIPERINSVLILY
jgi:hypothetical protein